MRKKNPPNSLYIKCFFLCERVVEEEEEEEEEEGEKE